MGWLSYNQMVEYATSKMIHQTIITGVPESLFSILHKPQRGRTRSALLGGLRPSNKRKLYFKQTISHRRELNYNRISKQTKIIGKGYIFNKDILNFVIL